MIDFPNSPAVGQVVTAPNGTAWRWTGSTWLLGTGASAGGGRGRVAYAQITTGQTIATAGADIAGLSVSWTADPTRTYRTTLATEVINSVANAIINLNIRDGAGAIKQRAVINSSSFASWPEAGFISLVESGLSGTIQRKGFALVSGGGGGTVSISADPTFPAYILVEDITYEAGSSGTPGTSLPGPIIVGTQAGASLPANAVATVCSWAIPAGEANRWASLVYTCAWGVAGSPVGEISWWNGAGVRRFTHVMFPVVNLATFTVQALLPLSSAAETYTMKVYCSNTAGASISVPTPDGNAHQAYGLILKG